ncbi:TonB-denpendent receptor [Sporocytophaga myxococcoides]|uniref:TonB-denpendent receptor n=1 Tax=Sporocytophaga myxococcoides TaxID=153721 RepID=A0A098LF43_9BACT|nr:TonB-dependent receptor [Sporocytophaga myxococcoides]GAL85064.1 TonB-denpendent receptor [Sporocytophaga myxococcoides]
MKKRYTTFKFKYLFIAFSLILIVQGVAVAQTVIKGRVVDDKTSEPAVGAVIQIKGTKEGTITDIDGNYELKTDHSYPFTLVLQYSGYETKEVEVYEAPEEDLNIQLKSRQLLNEVVVVGYGTQKRSDLTGSVATVPVESLKQPVSSVERLLQGSVAGVQVTQSTGQPGGGTSVQIRGNNSITAGTEPLYVIDGFPIYNDNASNDAGVTNGSKINPLSSINTSDIESIDVLKDASATAIYGSRGANGVVIVTTKKGSYNNSSINYDGYAGVQSVVREIPLMNAKEWGALRNDALINSNKSPQYTAAQLDSLGEGTDWQKAAFRQAAIQNHNLSVLTGNDKTRVAISGNYFKQDGVLINTDFERYSGRLNLDHEYSNRLRIGSYITASQISSNVAPQAVVPALLLMSPAVPIYNPDGSFVLRNLFEGVYGNPINTLKNQINETKTGRFLGNVSAEYKIFEGLTFKVLAGADVLNNKQNRYLPSTVYEGSGFGGLAQVGSIFSTNWLNENTINYTRRIRNVHNLNVLAGFTQQESVTKGSVSGSSGYATDAFDYNNQEAGNVTSIRSSGFAPSPSSFASRWALRSFLGRVNYGYREKYLLTVSLRADGSSKFAPGHKWGYFPSAAVAWNASNEDFLSQIKNLGHLKFRLSAGLIGNQQIPSYQSFSQLSYYRYNFGNNTVSGFAPNSIANPNLTWEKTAQYDFGADLGLLKNRIVIAADIYYKKTTDLLLNVPLPSTSGLWNIVVVNGSLSTPNPQVYQNYGAVENKGFELAVSSKNLIGKFQWSTSLVYAVNRNKVLSLGDGIEQIIPNSALPSIAAVGKPIGSFIVYQTDGVIPVGTSPDKALTPAANKNPGGQQYKDINGDGKITQAGDRVIIANQPKFIAGLTNTFSYRNFDLSIFLQTSYGNKLYNQNRATLELGTGYTGASTTLLNRWTPTNTNTDVHSAYQDPAATISDRFIEDASYIRLKNLTFGYTFPEHLVNKAKVKNIRVYISLQNYLTLTKYTGYDPEVSSNGQSAIDQGVDNGAYPNSKTFLGGLSFSF